MINEPLFCPVQCIKSKQGDSIYIHVCGSPGTGKSLSVGKITQALCEQYSGKVVKVHINAMKLMKPKDIYPNSIDLTDRFFPRLRARGTNPEVLAYKPYTHQELADILMERVSKSAEIKDTKLPVYFDKIAIQMCSRKIAGRSGDVRKGLDLCRQC